MAWSLLLSSHKNIKKKKGKGRVTVCVLYKGSVSERGKECYKQQVCCPKTFSASHQMCSFSADCGSSQAFSMQLTHQDPLHCLDSIALPRKLKIHISQICVTLNDHLNAQIGTPGIFHLPFVCWAGSRRALLRASLRVGFASVCD